MQSLGIIPPACCINMQVMELDVNHWFTSGLNSWKVTKIKIDAFDHICIVFLSNDLVY